MKLKNVKVFGFKSIKDTIDLLIDDKTTILIGANDHGKTNLLEAIQKLNDNQNINEIDKNWDLEEGAQTRIEWQFTISDDEINKIFSNNEIQEHQNIDDKVTEVKREDINSNLKNNNLNHEVIFYREGINSPLKILGSTINIDLENEKKLFDLKPRVELFQTPISINLKDDVTHADLLKPEYEFMQGIFHIAGLWDYKDIIFSLNETTSKLLNEGSNRLTIVLNQNWNQGHDLEWKLIHSGTNGDHILINIDDPAINTRFSRPSSRSSGFQTFFILSMMINARKFNNPSNSYIFLFDEPGTYLHPNAQIDLQRSFERSSEDTQIIYSTHSIFLINKNYPERNRVVNKNKEGTKINQKPFQKNWKAARDSLGVLLSNNFLIAEKTLFVEGPSDIIYFLYAIKQLKKENKIDIDLNDFSIVDAGNSEYYISMIKIMLSEGRDIVGLLDGDNQGRSIKEKLEKICKSEIEKGNLSIVLLPENKSIEDIFCDISLLRKSILKLSEDLIKNKERELVPENDLSQLIKEIKSTKTETLGYIISEKTKKWFHPEEKLSKLSIALVYEDFVKNNNYKISNLALDFIKDISDKMKFKGEKSTEKGVFEETKEK